MAKTFRFFLRFDDDKKSLSKLNGLTLKEIAILLKAIDELSNPGDNSFISLVEIKGGSYQLEGITTSEERENKIIRAHQNLGFKSFDELSADENKYANTLIKNLLKDARFLELYDNDEKLVARVTAKEIGREVDSYFTVKNVSGIISEIGSKSLNNKTHIEVDKLGYRIFTTIEQDHLLRQFYRDRRVTFKVKQKITLSNNKIASAVLIDFTPSTKGKLSENIAQLTNENLSFLSNISTHEQILKLIRG